MQRCREEDERCDRKYCLEQADTEDVTSSQTPARSAQQVEELALAVPCINVGELSAENLRFGLEENPEAVTH